MERRRKNKRITLKHRPPAVKKKTYGGEPRVEKQARQHVGLFLPKQLGGFLSPCHRKDPFSGTYIDEQQAKNFNEHDVIVYSVNREGEFHFIRNLGSITSPMTFSLMGIHAYGLPYSFSDEAIHQASKGTIPELGKRVDLRDLPLVTIDGADAKDFDDAVFAEPDPDTRNKGGWRAVVAIADVSHYVKPGDALDKEAHLRGNSVYFVDRVVPMLPERLSNDLCSLRPNEDRACLAVDMIISKDGKLKSYRFKRALMRSKARLTYAQVESALNGNPDSATKPLLDSVIQPLYGCYLSLKDARQRRGTIEIEKTENTFELADDGGIRSVSAKSRLQSHQLIEELMIAANVAAAKTLQAKDWPNIYRVHESPDKTRLQTLYTMAKNFKLPVKKITGTNVIASINHLLKLVKDLPFSRLFNELVLRSQAQARYSPHNVGHFGLSLVSYSHFTSPIRRYADLVVHRALIAAIDLDGQKQPAVDLDLVEVCEHISKRERVAMDAEREVQDRFMAFFMKDHLGSTFNGTIVGVGIPGLFVEIDNLGVQGLIHKHDLGDDFYTLDESQHCYIGRRTRKMYQLGKRVKILLTNADPITCSIGFSLVKDKVRDGVKERPKDKSFGLKDETKPKTKTKTKPNPKAKTKKLSR